MIPTEQLDEWQAVCDKATRELLTDDRSPSARFDASFILGARIAMPKLIAEVHSLREQLREYQTASLRRQMRDWSEDWYGAGWESQLSRKIWLCDEWDEEDVAKPSAKTIVEFGRSIDAWITDDGKVVTIAEWEAMLAEE